MEKSGRRRTGGLVIMVIFVVIMVLFSGLCWWLWNNREQGIPTRVLGYELMPMEGDSMEPELADGSVLLLNDAVSSELKSGDAIVYDRANGQGGTVVRIVNLTVENKETTLLVKSDRDLESTELSPEKVNSRVVGSIPLLGTFWDFIMTGRGLLTAIVAPCALFFLIEMAYLIYYARSGASERRRSEAGDLKRKSANHRADDQQENFVDVTARFAGKVETVPTSRLCVRRWTEFPTVRMRMLRRKVLQINMPIWISIRWSGRKNLPDWSGSLFRMLLPHRSLRWQ